METATLIREISRGDRKSFEQLFRKMQRPMLAYAMGILASDRQAAEDAVDEAFVDIWQSAASFSGTGNAEGWVRRIVRNKAVDLLRRQRGGRVADWMQALEEQADHAPSPWEIASAASQSAWLTAALGCLSVDQREAIILCYYEEYPLAEIAKIQGCPHNTIKTRLFHARLKMRHLAENAGIGPAEFGGT